MTTTFEIDKNMERTRRMNLARILGRRKPRVTSLTETADGKVRIEAWYPLPMARHL
jgi:hypothetical protein